MDFLDVDLLSYLGNLLLYHWSHWRLLNTLGIFPLLTKLLTVVNHETLLYKWCETDTIKRNKKEKKKEDVRGSINIQKIGELSQISHT